MTTENRPPVVGIAVAQDIKKPSFPTHGRGCGVTKHTNGLSQLRLYGEWGKPLYVGFAILIPIIAIWVSFVVIGGGIRALIDPYMGVWAGLMEHGG